MNPQLEITREGISLAVRFVKRGDRFGQEIVLKMNDGERVLAWSREDAANDMNAAPFIRPAFQECTAQRIGDAEVVFLVGMSHGLYWSATLQAEQGGESLLLDLSCRSTSFFPAIAAGYDFAEGTTTASDLQRILIDIEQGWRCQIELQALADAKGEVFGPPNCGFDFQIGPEKNNGAASVRWTQRFSLARGAEIE